jgi:hypothetical protein
MKEIKVREERSYCCDAFRTKWNQCFMCGRDFETTPPKPDTTKSYPLLKKAPPHNTPEFIDFLRENNVVVQEDNHWIVIENCKYHTKEKPWLTAFHKGHDHWTDCIHHLMDYIDWEWLKKAKSKQTVERFHIHLIQK